jgi:hypothetical protein
MTVYQGLAGDPAFAHWDRTLTIDNRNLPGNSLERIEAGGIVDAQQRIKFGEAVINQLRQSKSVHFLSLDADRAYPKKNINVNEIAQAYWIDWEGVE